MQRAILLGLLIALPCFAQVGQHATYKLLVDKDNGIFVYLPDSVYTPGVVRTTDLKEVCSEKTKQFRTSTKEMRAEAYVEYQVKKGGAQRYEVDDLIPLELGGANVVPNFWPQPFPQAHWKDVTEDWLHKEVCAGRRDLVESQHAIAENWYLLYQEMNSGPRPIEKHKDEDQPAKASLR